MVIAQVHALGFREIQKVVPLALISKLVFAHEIKQEHHRRTDTQPYQAKTEAEAEVVCWNLPLEIDVGRDNT